MAGKLKSVIQSPRFGLPLKAAAFFLLFRWASGDGVLAAVFFVGVSIVMYARPTLNALVYIPSFAVLMGLAFLFPSAGMEFAGEVLGLALAGLFYVLLRLKELLFIRRLWWHEALAAGLLYVAALGYFAAGVSEYFLLKHLGLGAVFFLLAYELLAAHSARDVRPRQGVAACAVTLLFLELVWAIALLPIGYAADSGIAAIFGFLLLHLSVVAATGHLKPVTVMKHAALAVVIALIIGLLSSWKP